MKCFLFFISVFSGSNFIFAQNSVGIGTPNPNATLDVLRGTAPWGTAAFRGTTNISHFNLGVTEDTYIRAGKVGSHVILNDIGIGNVGIGTFPQTRLDIAGTNGWDLVNGEGDIRLGNSTYRLKLGVALSGGGAGATGIMQYGTVGGYNALALGSQGKNLITLYGNNNVVELANVVNGKVGVGTANPVFKLDVQNGSINTDSIYRIGTITVLSVQGTGNLFVGRDAGIVNTGNSNTFSGDQAGYSNTDGLSNAFFGRKAGFTNTAGYYNSFFGMSAGFSNIGSGNSFFGTYAGSSNSSGFANSFFGQAAGMSSSTSSYNSFFGSYAGYSNTTGDNNSFFGQRAGFANNTGYYNSFFGGAAGHQNTTGVQNSFFGQSAGYTNTSGGANSFFGGRAGYSNTTGSDNSFFGWNSGYSNTTGSYNSFIGQGAGSSNTTGNGNCFFGLSTGINNSTGSHNSFYGRYSGLINTSGDNNTAYGFYSLSANTTGTNNTAVGYNSGVTTGALSNSTAIGYGAAVDADNKVIIGNTSVSSIGGQVGWTTFSDGRFKQQVQEDVPGLVFIKKLRTITYQVDLASLNIYYAIGKSEIHKNTLSQLNPKSQTQEINRQCGFIAQEVDQAAKELGFSFSGVDKPKSEKALFGLRYGDFVVPIVKAIQEQQAMIEQQNTIIEQQNRKIEMLMKEINQIKEKLR